MSAILPPAQRVWWKQPLDRVEVTWIVIAFVWCLIMFFMMPYWHVFGKQNLSNEAYRTTPEMFTSQDPGDGRQVQGARGDRPEDPGGAAARRQRRLPDRAAVAVVADARAREGQTYRLHLIVDGLAARLLAAAREHQHPGASRLRARDHRARRTRPAPTRSSATSTAASAITRWSSRLYVVDKK